MELVSKGTSLSLEFFDTNGTGRKNNKLVTLKRLQMCVNIHIYIYIKIYADMIRMTS